MVEIAPDQILREIEIYVSCEGIGLPVRAFLAGPLSSNSVVTVKFATN
jgi:hypothetical protein